MRAIKTYNDYIEAASKGEKEKIAFMLVAIAEHKNSDLYKTAADAELYYDGENPTINKYEKILYDMQGKAHVDMWTANHKIASHFFGLAIDQENFYLLGNGVTLQKAGNKDKLGTKSSPFDQEVMRAGRMALVDGVSYGFWNFDHIEVFTAREFVPLIDEEDGSLKAGIRFWQIDDNKPMRVTLFEIDGYADYIKWRNRDMEELLPKRAYILRMVGSAIDRARGEAIYHFENYPGFPIVPLKNNDDMKSELCGRRNTIDALDLGMSSMINNVDEGNLIYWVLTNCGGMDDLDDQKFLERLKTLHVVHADGNDGATAEPHTIEAPFTGTQTTVDMLKKQLYEDFQAFDSSAVSAGNQTATAIKASYVPLDLKCDKFEAQVTKFINGILALAGIDDEPSYTRNQIINKQEETQTVLSGAQYFDEEYITHKLLTILGDADQADAILKRKAAEELDRFNAMQEQTEGENGNQANPSETGQ